MKREEFWACSHFSSPAEVEESRNDDHSEHVCAVGPKIGAAFLRFLAFKFRVLLNCLLRYIYFRHAQICDNVRVQSATQWAASVRDGLRRERLV